MSEYFYNRTSWKCNGCGIQWAPHIDSCKNCSIVQPYVYLAPPIVMNPFFSAPPSSGFLQTRHYPSPNACCVMHYDASGNRVTCQICANCGKHFTDHNEFVNGICNLNNIPGSVTITSTRGADNSDTSLNGTDEEYDNPTLSIKTYEESVDKFLEDVVKKCYDNNIKFTISLTDYVKFGNSETKSNGFFVDGDEPELAFSFKGDYSIWLTTLIHESCHMDQYLEIDPLWLALKKEIDGVEEDEDLIFDWIDHKREADPAVLKELIKNTKYMELDCEKRVVKRMEEYNLPLDRAMYTKRANAYALFYNYMEEARAWYVIRREPYNNEAIIALMSDKFDMDYDNITDELRNLFNRCCRN